MEQGEPPAALYDFLYRDAGRMASYYAQIFNGRLSSLEQSDTDRTSEDKGAKLDIHIASGDLKHTSETTRSSKRVIDPHDTVTIDVLSYLQNSSHIEPSVLEAAHGDLVLTHGTLVLIDRAMAELAVLSFDLMISEEERKPKAKQDQASLQGMRFIREFLPQISMPSAFVLQGSDGCQVAGTIKEEGMEEPISSYYFKHGAAGLSDVYLVGIKETPSESFTLPSSSARASRPPRLSATCCSPQRRSASHPSPSSANCSRPTNFSPFRPASQV